LLIEKTVPLAYQINAAETLIDILAIEQKITVAAGRAVLAKP
jgi:hypothetical protein